MIAYELVLEAGIASAAVATDGAASTLTAARLALIVNKLKKLGPIGDKVGDLLKPNGPLAKKLGELFSQLKKGGKIEDGAAPVRTATNPALAEGAEFSVRLNPTTRTGPMAVDTSVFKSGEATLNGGIRNSKAFWRSWRDSYGDTLSETNKQLIKAGRSPVVDDQWLKHFPEHTRFKDEALIHHHLDYGPNAIPLPETVHSRQPGWGIWHEQHAGGN